MDLPAAAARSLCRGTVCIKRRRGDRLRRDSLQLQAYAPNWTGVLVATGVAHRDRVRGGTPHATVAGMSSGKNCLWKESETAAYDRPRAHLGGPTPPAPAIAASAVRMASMRRCTSMGATSRRAYLTMALRLRV